MSQRTRSRTTGAATHKASAAGAAASEQAGAVKAPAPREKRSRPDARSSEAPSVESIEPPTDASPSMSAETLARTLRAVAAELERDPALARRVASAVSASADDGGSVGASSGRPDAYAEAPKSPKRAPRAFTPRLVTGAGPELGTGIPDPFALRDRLGYDGLCAALDELRLGTLRAIVREHHLDPTGKLVRQGDAAKLRETILTAVAAR